jgi:phenylpyruvate tautomerase PptA (4-oxalocrotonate tautomerase family)
MPLYEVGYSIPLTQAHRNILASKITKLHHETYGIPSFFVSVKFTDDSKNENYSGGELVRFSLFPSALST